MSAAFLLNAMIVASLIALISFAAVAILRTINARAAYVAAVIAFFCAAGAPFATISTSPEPPALNGRGAAIAVREEFPIVATLWFAGGLLLLVRELVAHRALALLKGRRLADEELRRMRVPVDVEVHAIDGASPMTIGAFRPRIVIPSEMLHQSVEIARAVLGHELSHVRWRDPLLKALVRIALLLLWPVFPLWALERLIRREREGAADAAAVMNLEAQAVCSYAEAMLMCARRRSSAAALGIGESDLEHRVRRLFRSRGFSSLSMAGSVAPITFAALGLGFAPSFIYRPNDSLSTVRRAVVVDQPQASQPVSRHLEPKSRAARDVMRRPAAEIATGIADVPFGSSFSDLNSRAPGASVHRHVDEAVSVIRHEHRPDPPTPRVNEIIVIRDVRREVIRIRR